MTDEPMCFTLMHACVPYYRIYKNHNLQYISYTFETCDSRKENHFRITQSHFRDEPGRFFSGVDNTCFACLVTVGLTKYD